ncbi:hypothetical protein CYMTET_18554 [Cymbomonas tetramitiformis]|uniref:HAT C-terminal dimerisation domain-containing protein n=1 Tax=Cymbomonas tetramitiformis TaxID=36881 RepID=A0AAE0L5T2_9CHLO|nr:hypothetical protein CYMTET_18554 [Cymbomonas tetramitiformis]
MGGGRLGKRARKQTEEVLLAQGKGPVKRTQLHPFDAAGSDEREYFVDKILATRTRYGVQQWLIQWEDLDDDDDFQAPQKSLRSPFWKHFSVRMEGKKIVEYRPLTLPEKDVEFRDIFEEIFRGGYTPPSYQIVVDTILTLSVEGKRNVMAALAAVLSEGILPSIGGDIWSQGGIAIFGVLVYWIDKEFKYHERLVGAIPFSSVRHTGPELEVVTKRACASLGIGKYEVLADTDAELGIVKTDTVAEYIHCTVSDNASNIVISGWNCFDGHECVDHTIALTVKAYLEQTCVKKVFAKLRGMTGHFNHSVIGVKLLYDCQKRNDLRETTPPQDNDTRSGWGGACRQATWYMQNREARRRLYLDITKRYFQDLMECKVENFCVATILDPRYKNVKFRNVGKWLRGTLTRDQAVKWTRKAYEAGWKVKEKNANEDALPPVKKAKTTIISIANFLAEDSDDEDSEMPDGVRTVVATSQRKDELTRYLELPDVALVVDLLVWWREHAIEFPQLSKMARQFLAVPATTAGVERAFSKVSRMHSDLRKNLTEGVIEHSVMACMNTVEC